VADLKLGPLPSQSTVRLTMVLLEPLKEELDAYAAEHSRHYEPVETAALILHMLQAFLRTDRAWCSRRKQQRLGMSLPDFEACRVELERRGFPERDPTTGRYCIEAEGGPCVASRVFPELTVVPIAADARTVVEDRLRALEGADVG
jgi:hypothetical protein